MSLEQLDAFISQVRADPQLRQRFQNSADPPELEEFLAVARDCGFQVEAEDVIAAQQRADDQLSDEEVQRRAGQEARRLRSFIHS